MEIIIIGGGHAGVEAALVSARRGFKTLLITNDLKKIASLPCNPAIGGSAKGIVVREIDALGGEMGKIADQATLQMKLLNKSKGPAVRALRAQIDKQKYTKKMQEKLKKQTNLTLLEATIIDLDIKNNIIKGVILENNKKIKGKIVILTTGTYLNSFIIQGEEKKINPLNKNLDLNKYGFKLLKLKTDTPPILKRETIDFTLLKEEKGDEEPLTFSFDKKLYYNPKKQIICYLGYTNIKTHQIILENINKNNKSKELKKGIGPRYCPSIETKIIRFPDRNKHQIFLEPVTLNNNNIYCQGLFTSLDPSVQTKMIRSIKGLEQAEIIKYGFAVEYDAIDPLQLKPTLETKIIENLWTAGQINGTSGYEEAAAQGFMAGLNATLKLEGKEPLILKRNEAYIGVLIDDIVTKGVSEPYRLLSSRAEYRLLLRSDNADLRLKAYAYQYGLINEKEYKKIKAKENKINELIPLLKKDSKLKIEIDKDIINQVKINIKYSGYINKMEQEIVKMMRAETKQIPSTINYHKVPNLAIEAKEKLNQIRPLTLGQAKRISGITPSDITMLMIYLRKYEND